MLAIDIVAFLMAAMVALLAIVLAIIGAVHVWLRTTVGKFHSNVSFCLLIIGVDLVMKIGSGNDGRQNCAHNWRQQRARAGNGPRLGEKRRADHYGQPKARSGEQSSRLALTLQ